MRKLTTNNPFDILVKDFLSTASLFDVPETLHHPVDIYEDCEGLTLEIACTGLKREDVEINVEGETLKVSYKKEKDDEDLYKTFHYSGIRKRSFDLGWKISRRFNLNDINASMKHGLLAIDIPYSEESKPRSIKIK